MPAVKDVLSDISAGGGQHLHIGRRLFFCVPIVTAAAPEQNRWQHICPRRNVRRDVSREYDQTAALSRRRGTIGHRHSLREPDEHQRPMALTAAADRVYHGPDVGGVVGDGELAILFRHPRGDNLSSLGIETVQRLDAHQIPALADGPQLLEHHLGVFGMTVKSNQQRGVSGGIRRRGFDDVSSVRARLDGVDNHNGTIMSRMTIYPAADAASQDALLVLAHGAGAGQLHPFMVRYGRGLAERGLDVATFNFPYMESGRKSPDRAPVLEQAFRKAVVDAAAKVGRRGRLLIGGKSMGGRMATHLAAAPGAWPPEAPPLDGVIVLGYPLSSGKQDRVSHLYSLTVPTLIVQGTRDNFGGPQDIERALGTRQPLITVHPVNTGDHSFAVLKSGGKSQAEADQDVWERIISWLPRPRTASAI